MHKIILLFTLVFCFFPVAVQAQQVQTGEEITIDPNNPREYQIGGISVTGTENINENVVIMVSQLTVGQEITIPGEDITNAIEQLWRQRLFEDVSIGIISVQDDVVFLEIELKERPRLSSYEFIGAKKSDEDEIKERLNLTRGDVVTDNLLYRAQTVIEDYYQEEGYMTPEVEIRQKVDTARTNQLILEFEIDRGRRTRIREVNIYGNEVLSDWKIKRLMEDTRERSLLFLFSSSKLVEEDFRKDKQRIIERYNELGKRDARIVKDSVYFVDDNRIEIDLHIEEGPTYYFRDINWVGNTVYSDEDLNEILQISSGDEYNQTKLEQNLSMNMEQGDVSSLYLDIGYLFFNLDPVEVAVENDSIDLEIRIHEGEQARINRVSVTGNTRTNDHVIMREIRTRPGQLFSRSAIIRSQREIIQLGYFDQESIEVNPIPNPQDNTVDIEYILEETSSDQIELSGGWGANRIIGTVGISFNNFSTRNFFNKDAWRPLPTGDGQTLSLRAQTYGRGYISYSASFVEPWLGGEKPNALSVSFYQTTHRRNLARSDPNYGYYSILGASVGLAKRLTLPDDYFYLRQSANYQHYDILNSPIRFIFDNGQSHNLSYNVEFGRNSKDADLFPRSGSEVSLSLQLTPPYTLVTGENLKDADPQDKYRWLEYHKWKMKTDYFTPIVGDLIVAAKIRYGFLGFYNSDIGYPPFERFYLGGDGLTGWEIDGREVIAMRGYENYSLTPTDAQGEFIGANAYSKYSVELRYPVSLNPMATIYALAFVEGGNAFSDLRSFNPFDIKRSAGVGVRVFLPMFGLLGIDYGYGFDDIPGRPNSSGGQFHFSIGQDIN
ncbi:MAG: outer membrane protein assembly factor BamA [Bacteroidales bacterium]